MSMHDLRLQPQMTTEREIVLLVRTVPFEDAVKLIAQYGRTCAAEGRLQATVESNSRFEAILDT